LTGGTKGSGATGTSLYLLSLTVIGVHDVSHAVMVLGILNHAETKALVQGARSWVCFE
jgi:hypothetical protein